MELKSNALAELMGRLKLAACPASRCFLVALFLWGFSSSYFGDLRSKTYPEYAARADVENHLLKSAIVFAHAGGTKVVAPSTPRVLFESVNPLQPLRPVLARRVPLASVKALECVETGAK